MDTGQGEQEIPHRERALFKGPFYNPRDDKGLEQSEGRHC